MIMTIHKFSHSKGLSLIELMIAMVIGLLLLTGTASMFISNKRIYKEQDEMGRIQENARFAMQMLIEDIRMAGYAGCSEDIDEITNHLNDLSANPSLQFSNAVEGVNEADSGTPANSQWQPSNSEEGVSAMVDGTDAISIRYVDPSGIRLSEAMPKVSAELKVTTTGDLAIGDIVALSDCDAADIFQLTQVQVSSSHLQHNAGKGGGLPSPGNLTKPLSKKYGEGAEIVRFISRRYYIGTGTNGSPSLFRMENGGTAVELIEGVENMEILYGEDTLNNDTIPDTYVHAGSVSNWDNVVSVRVSLLFRTIDDNASNAPNTSTYSMLDTTFDPTDDRRRRRVVTNTVQIRNRSN